MGLYDMTIGTLLVGVFFNTFLYGLVTYQFALYYQTRFNDPPAIKYMVIFLFIVDTFQSASAIYLAWYYTVTNYDNPAALALSEWPYEVTPICTALTALVTQIYLGFRQVFRIWRLTNSKVLYGVVIVLSISSFVLGFTCSVEAWIITVLSELPRITPLVIGWLTTQVVVDSLITITLVIIFSRSRTGFHRTDTVLNRLIRGAIQTGLFAGIFSMGDLVTFLVLPNTNLYGMFAIPVGRIYTNTLLASLLNRDSLKAELNATYDVSGGLGSINWAGMDSSQATSEHSTSNLYQVRKTVQQTCDPSTGEDTKEKVVPLPV